MGVISSDDVPDISDKELLERLAALDSDDFPIARIAELALEAQEEDS